MSTWKRPFQYVNVTDTATWQQSPVTLHIWLSLAICVKNISEFKKARTKPHLFSVLNSVDKEGSMPLFISSSSSDFLYIWATVTFKP